MCPRPDHHRRTGDHPLFGRRSRWVRANVGETPAISRVPPEALEERGAGFYESLSRLRSPRRMPLCES
jgi:hypothetical protein